MKLSLATSTPAKWGDAPELKSWFLGYVDPTLQTRQLLQGKLAGVNIENSANLNEVVVVGYGAASKDREYEEKTPAYIVNGSIISETAFRNIRATTIKDKQRIPPSEAIALYGSRASGGAVVITLKEGLADYVTETDNQLNVVFDIELPYDVPSNGKAQTAVLKETKVPATYQYFAVPKADAQAYLLADIHGWSALNLLPGEANIIFEGTYVGKSFIDPQSTSDTLHLTLARDKRVIIRREKLTDFSSTKFIGNNKLQKLTYEITIRNNKKEIVTLTMKDQYPLATTKDIEVELLEHGTANVDKETGMLDWFFQLKPGETKKIRIGYSVKYSKYKTINLN